MNKVTPQKSQFPTSEQYAKTQEQERFRRCLRDADALIKERRFEQAKIRLDDAKKIDPSNSYIKAFEERIRMFEQNTDQVSNFFPKPSPAALKAIEELPAVTIPGNSGPVSQELLESQLRKQIEEQYKKKFMDELRQAEQTLKHERDALEKQRHALQTQHERQMTELQRRTEEEYHQHLSLEITAAEQRMKQQFEIEQVQAEQKMKTQLNEQYEDELRQMRVRMELDHVELLEEERRTFEERERILKEQFDTQLQEAFRTQGITPASKASPQQDRERQKLRQRLEKEFQAGLSKVRDSFKKQYDGLKSKLEQKLFSEQTRIKEKHTQETNQQLELVRKQERLEFERSRNASIRDVEAILKNKYHAQLIAERKRLQEEGDASLENSRRKIQDEYESKLVAQNENIQKLRSEIRSEMEQTFLRRLEQISKQYDQKMELFGVRTPNSPEESVSLYCEKMSELYADGQPTVDGAKKLMELKEILGITFDHHCMIESEVRLDLYVRQAERLILNGTITKTSQQLLEELKAKFRIHPGQAVEVQQYLDSCFQRFAGKGRVLVVDDDRLLLKEVEAVLRSCGFDVIVSEYTDSAIDLLKDTAVDVILSDIKFPEGQPDGFSFFASVQEQPHLRKLPFIFMSSLIDGVIVRSGVQLGVDDYLTKPLDLDLAVAVIEGKLKRYRNFVNN